MKVRSSRLTALLLAGLTGACGEDPPVVPPPPTELLLSVEDAATGNPIAGARVLIRGEGRWHRTDDTGTLRIELSPGEHLVRVEAAGYLPSPTPLSVPRPIHLAEHVTSPREISLERRPGYSAGGLISGKLTRGGAPVSGALVVASATAQFSTLSGADGAFEIPGVSPNFYSVRAFMKGTTVAPRTAVEVKADQTVADVDFSLMEVPGATAGGRLIGATGTSSVVLFHPDSGEPIPGLDVLGTFGGSWQLDGLPEGEYGVAAFLEPEGFFLDPELLRVNGPPVLDVAGTSSITADLFFVDAMTGIGPVDGEAVSARPVFRWAPVASADFYVVEVLDPAGRVVWGGLDFQGNVRLPILAPATSIEYAGEALVQGSRYSWRIFAAERDPVISSNFHFLSASEVLAGSFRVTR